MLRISGSTWSATRWPSIVHNRVHFCFDRRERTELAAYIGPVYYKIEGNKRFAKVLESPPSITNHTIALAATQSATLRVCYTGYGASFGQVDRLAVSLRWYLISLPILKAPWTALDQVRSRWETKLEPLLFLLYSSAFCHLGRASGQSDQPNSVQCRARRCCSFQARWGWGWGWSNVYRCTDTVLYCI